jgi:hypothetical protein
LSEPRERAGKTLDQTADEELTQRLQWRGGHDGEEMALGLLEGTDVNVLYESGVFLMEGAGMWALFFP